MFYLSLKILKECYKSNSHIISLGESPGKIVMIQSFFYKDTDTLSKLNSTGMYPTNLTFGYFPLSGLSKYAISRYDDSTEDLASIDLTRLKYYLDTNISDMLINKYLKYFKKYSLDPESIIQTDKNYIFLDRCELYRTVVSFIYIYYKIIIKQNLTKEQINKFLNQFKIVGFDGNYDSFTTTTRRNNKIYDFIKILYGSLINNINKYDRKLFQFYTIKIYETETRENIYKFVKSNKNITGRLTKKYNYIYINYAIPNNIINFLSLPEHLEIGSRCIKSRKINTLKNENIDNINISKIKNNLNSQNCNLFNIVLYLFFSIIKNKENNESLYYLIYNLDKIDEFKISSLYTEFLDPLLFNQEKSIKDIILDILENDTNTIFDINSKYIIPIKKVTTKNNLFNAVREHNFISKHNIIKSESNNKNRLEFYSAGGKNKILCLDFDETLGSFHINYSTFSILLNNFIQDTNKKNLILKELLILYHMRPNLDIFFKELKIMKNEGKINKIYILSSNSSEYHPNYFINTIKLIEEITDSPDLIDNIYTKQRIKNLNIISNRNNCDTIYIVDDKCENVIPRENCINIKPFVMYEDYSVFIDILNKYEIDEEIISEISKIIKNYTMADFNTTNQFSFISQYPQIKNFKNKFKPNKNHLVKRNNSDNELLRVLSIIKEIYL